MFASRTNWLLASNRFTQALEDHRRSGKTLLDLTASNPTTCEFNYPEKDILTALADSRSLVYRPESKGLRDAREAVAGYYRGRPGFDGEGRHYSHSREVDPENIVLTSGTSEGYSHIFRLLCEPGDEVLVPVPGYPLFEFLADLGDIRLIPYSLLYDHGWQIDMEALRHALTARSRAILLVHPNNPTGSFVQRHEAAELTRICADRDMALIVDEVFLDYAALDNTAGAPASFAFQAAALTFTLSGISKICALPQMKLAWMVVSGPEELARMAVERLEIIADTYLSPGTPVQIALPRFLALRGGLQTQLRERIAANLEYFDAFLLQNPGPVQRLVHDAGWYVILRVPFSMTDDDLAIDLLRHRSVLVHPGHFFNFSQEGFLVVSLIAAEAAFQEGIRRLCGFFGG